MEPGHRDSGVHSAVYPQLPEDRHGPEQRRRGVSGRAGDHCRPVPAGLPAPDAGVSRAVRQRHRRANAQTARDRPAHRPADDRGGDGPRGSVAPRDHRDRRGSARAHRGDAGTPGERAVRGRAALRADPADAEPAADGGRFRRRDPPRDHDRQAAGGAHELDHGQRQGRRGRVPAAERESEARRRVVPGRQVSRGARRDRRRAERVLRRPQERSQDPREAQGEVRAGRHAGDSQHDHGFTRRHQALLRRQRPAGTRRPSRCARAISC